MNPEMTEAVDRAREAFLNLQARLRELGQYEAVEHEFDRLRLTVTDVIDRSRKPVPTPSMSSPQSREEQS